MKIILKRDVKGVGRAHETITTSDGYALNYLIPHKLAVPATPAAVKEAETRKKQATDRHALDATLLAKNLASLAEARVVVKTKANDKGHLYDAVGEEDLSKAIKEQTNLDVPASVIKLEKPIKELGTFTIPVAAGETFGSFQITLEARA